MSKVLNPHPAHRFTHNPHLPPRLPGASSGLGRHAAVHLARTHGFTVLAGVRRESDRASLLDPSLPTLIPIVLDVTNPSDIAAAVAAARATGLPVWGLVNNAGLGYPMPLELVDVDKARAVFEVNVLAVIAMVQAFAPLLRKGA